MALKKEIELNTGVIVTYWKISYDTVKIVSNKNYTDNNQPLLPELINLGENNNPIMFNQEIEETSPQIRMLLFGYLNEEARRAGKQPLQIREASIDCPASGNFTDERRILLYSMLRQQEFWKDSVDA